MRRFGIVLSTFAIGFLFIASTVYAEITKKGSGEIRGTKSGTMQFLKMGEDRNQINFEESGVILDAPEGSPFYHATWYGMGTLHGYKGKYKATGAIVYTCTNGDQIFAVIGTEGMHSKGLTGGAVKFVGGTGSCSGIEGELIPTPRPPTKSSKPGTYQHIVLGKINWKIP